MMGWWARRGGIRRGDGPIGMVIPPRRDLLEQRARGDGGSPRQNLLGDGPAGMMGPLRQNLLGRRDLSMKNPLG